ncbi:IS66 family insertion sequence element accessory protein TnpA, partial [Pseudochryseolinea flava]
SKKAFCRDRNITYQTFHYWCKRLSLQASSGFSEVKLSEVEPVNTFEVDFPSGARVTFHGTPPTTWLRELLK